MNIDINSMLEEKRDEMAKLAEKHNAINSQILELQKVMQESFEGLKKLENEIGLLIVLKDSPNGKEASKKK